MHHMTMASIFLFSAVLQTLIFLSASQFEEIPMCADIRPPLHSKMYIAKNNSYYVVHCDTNYSIIGKSVVRCVNGEWDALPPKCIENNTDACVEPPTPVNGEKVCNDGPLVPGKGCRFSCLEGYELSGVNLRLCMFNFQFSGRNPRCIPIKSTLCPAPKPLKHGVVYSCSPKSPPKVGKSCHFRCGNRYVLHGPSTLVCRANGKLTDLEGKENFPECVARSPPNVNDSFQVDLETHHSSDKDVAVNEGSRDTYLLDSPCEKDNGGCSQICRVFNGRVHCRCRKGYSLAGDRKSCVATGRGGHVYKLNPCMERNGGCQHICKFERNETKCSCREGYVQHDDQKSCIDINECEDRNFGCSDSCVNTPGSAYCSCPTGYTLDVDNKTCIDINECAGETLNKCQHECINTEGSYRCSCHPGYIQIDEFKCVGCRKGSYWSYADNGCVDCPANSFTNAEAKTSIYDCICLEGYVGDPAQRIPCQDVNECIYNNFGCSDTCVNTPGSAYCSCPVGYMVHADNKTCIDIDECSIKNGGCEGICINTDGGFQCKCSEGYVVSNRDTYSCDDIDECVIDNGGCEQLCVNYPGGYYCACENGHRLDSGLKSCNDIQCPRLPVPHFSSMTCKRTGKPLEISESYPTGTICNFKCGQGFKNVAPSNKVECQDDGTWKGNLPECKSLQCPPLVVPENGEVHPPSCSRDGNSVKQICTFTCHLGYKLKGKPVFRCKNNLQWNVDEIPICEPIKVQATMTCPRDISVDLLPGKSTRSITVPEPVSSVENIKVKPKWITIGEPVEFPAGETNVLFTATDPKTSRPARCTMTVNVMDKEPPLFEYCPDPIEIKDASADGILVDWEEPLVIDNVLVESVESTLKPNTTFTPGSYVVEYIAKDAAGNIASCSFDINITRIQCDDLQNPAHGEANCMDWMFGKLCQPFCDDGYMRNPTDPQFHSCSESGEWEPSTEITDCLRYIPTQSSACPPGYELQINGESVEEICMECPRDTIWSATTKACEK